MTLEEAWTLTENLNEEAHQLAWGLWAEADELGDSEEEDNWIAAEEKREEASEEQAQHFRDLYHDLSEEDRADIIHWLNLDEDFSEQFSSWFGEEHFKVEFDFSED